MVELEDGTIIQFKTVDNGCTIEITEYDAGNVTSNKMHVFQDDKDSTDSKLSHTERLRDFLRMLNEYMSVNGDGQKIDIKIIPD